MVVKRQIDFDNIPIIDLALWWSSDHKERQQVVDNVHEACTQVGFFYIKVHIFDKLKHDMNQRLKPSIESWHPSAPDQ